MTDLTNFSKELAQLINKYSLENGSDTPDYILADYLVDCLQAFNRTLIIREHWYGRGHKKPENKILCEEQSAEKLADTIIKLAESYRYHCLCARSTIFPGKTIEEVNKILKYHTAEYLLDTNYFILTNTFRESVRQIIREKTGTIPDTEKCTNFMFLSNNTMMLNGKKYKLIPYENVDDWEITMIITASGCPCGHNGKIIPDNMKGCIIQAVRVGKQTFEVGQCVKKGKGIIENFDFENGRVVARVRYNLNYPFTPNHGTMDIIYL
jgi:hypothetical protein